MSKITKKSVNALMDVYKNHKTNVVLTLTDPDNEDAVLMEIPIKNEMSIDEQGMFVERGGWIMQMCIGTTITNGLNLMFDTTRFTPDIIPLACGTLATIGSFFKTRVSNSSN